MSYTKVGKITEACRRELLAQVPEKMTKDANDGYLSSGPMPMEALQHPGLLKIWPAEQWLRASFIVLPAGLSITPHFHHDTDHVKHHVVLTTNVGCKSANGGEELKHLVKRGVYRMAPAEMHEACNLGTTDRVHLVVAERRG